MRGPSSPSSSTRRAAPSRDASARDLHPHRALLALVDERFPLEEAERVAREDARVAAADLRRLALEDRAARRAWRARWKRAL